MDAAMRATIIIVVKVVMKVNTLEMERKSKRSNLKRRLQGNKLKELKASGSKLKEEKQQFRYWMQKPHLFGSEDLYRKCKT